MAENKEGINGVLEKLALLTDACQNFLPNGKTAIIFELNKVDYNFIRINLNQFGDSQDKFKVDISGVEVIFILEGSYQSVEPEVPKKKNIFQKLRFLIGGKPSV